MTDTMPQRVESASDEQVLLRRLRAGEDDAFGELFELHAAAVRRLASGLASDRSEAEDITAETFFRVLQALRRGAGPRDHVRAYLLTVARRVSWEWHGARRDVPVTDDELTVRAGAGADAHSRTAEHSLITTAFSSLPERWRSVLWRTEVEGEQPAVVAPHFGLSANATAALARRARQGLRAAYLQAHLAVNRAADGGCRTVTEKLGGYTAGSVTGAEARKIRAHLITCSSCRSLHAELRDVCSSLRAHSGVVMLLVPGSVAVLSGASSTGSGAGLGATLKGLLLSSKMKVGLALASVSATAFGAVAGPNVIDPAHTRTIGLPGQGQIELSLSPQRPSVPSSSLPPQAAQPDQVIIRFQGPVAGQEENRGHAQAGVPGVPAGLPGPYLPATVVDLPGIEQAETTEKSPEPETGSPRIDTGDPDPGESDTFHATEIPEETSTLDKDPGEDTSTSAKPSDSSGTGRADPPSSGPPCESTEAPAGVESGETTSSG